MEPLSAVMEYTDEDLLLMETIDALLVEEQPLQQMQQHEEETHEQQQELRDEFEAASRDAFEPEPFRFDVELASPLPVTAYEAFDISSPLVSPRGFPQDEPLCFPSNKPTSKRKRAMSQALEFSLAEPKLKKPHAAQMHEDPTPFALDNTPVQSREQQQHKQQQHKQQHKQQQHKQKEDEQEMLQRQILEPQPVLRSKSELDRLRRKEGSDKNRVLTSSYRGVCWYKRTQRWVVQIKVKGVRVHIGYYKDELEAARSYERAMAKIRINPDIDRAELRAC